MMFALLTLGLALGIGPYDGPPLPGSIPNTVKFAVRVSGRAGATVALRALGVPTGYIASFCTRLVCSRDRVSLVIPASGRDRIELQFIENDPGSRAPKVVTVAAAGARPVTIAFSHGARAR